MHKRTAFNRGASLATAALILCAGACAPVPLDPAEKANYVENNDPFEPLNREIFDLNLFIDRILLKPVAQIYIAVLPEDGRNAIRRVLDNMKEPIIVANNVLQGEFDRAGISLQRFAVNTTVGVGGTFDFATKWGIERQSGDFGQTLFVWGLPEGPYIIVPVLGPSNPRDGVGSIVDAYADPFRILANAKGIDEMNIVRGAIDGIDQRARVIDVLEELRKNSLDFYAQLRSLTRQRRAAELRHGTVPEAYQNLYLDPAKAAPAAPAPAASPTPDLYADPVRQTPAR